VRPTAVVVGGKLGEHGLEMRLIDDDEVVETLRPNSPHHPLGHRIRFRRPRRRPYAGDTVVAQSRIKSPP